MRLTFIGAQTFKHLWYKYLYGYLFETKYANAYDEFHAHTVAVFFVLSSARLSRVVSSFNHIFLLHLPENISL